MRRSPFFALRLTARRAREAGQSAYFVPNFTLTDSDGRAEHFGPGVMYFMPQPATAPTAPT